MREEIFSVGILIVVFDVMLNIVKYIEINSYVIIYDVVV